jgi:ATP-dependent DNA ligase
MRFEILVPGRRVLRHARHGSADVRGDLVLPVRRLPPNGLEAWAAVLEHGYEGWVGKDEASPYRGGPTRSWLKVKVPGWTDTNDRWQRRLTAR